MYRSLRRPAVCGCLTGDDSKRLKDQGEKAGASSAAEYGSADHHQAFAASLAGPPARTKCRDALPLHAVRVRTPAPRSRKAREQLRHANLWWVRCGCGTHQERPQPLANATSVVVVHILTHLSFILRLLFTLYSEIFILGFTIGPEHIFTCRHHVARVLERSTKFWEVDEILCVGKSPGVSEGQSSRISRHKPFQGPPRFFGHAHRGAPFLSLW
ncbi:MAG: hypothetical protein QOH40_1644 [Arthrobacter pascens]|nr:hypothetical protein [Arthrobacter pascens]